MQLQAVKSIGKSITSARTGMIAGLFRGCKRPFSAFTQFQPLKLRKSRILLVQVLNISDIIRTAQKDRCPLMQCGRHYILNLDPPC
mmetsp:Transcript_15385/g.23958  ORF Transcript_15385/g.23958 Transcript_15385/m.23958 type:complete len:86 (-) Transcript_15385:608-865(-)